MSNDTARSLATNVRRLRIAARLSLSQLARATGVGKATLSAIENGRGNPTVETMAALAAALGVPVVDLLEVAAAPPLTVVRASEREAASQGMVRLGRLATGDLRLAELEPRAEVESEGGPAGTRVHVVVVRNTLVAGPVERITELGRGDYAAFAGDAPYVLRTAARGATAVVVVERA